MRAGIPFSEPERPLLPSPSPPPLLGPEAEGELFGSKSLEEQDRFQQSHLQVLKKLGCRSICCWTTSCSACKVFPTGGCVSAKLATGQVSEAPSSGRAPTLWSHPSKWKCRQVPIRKSIAEPAKPLASDISSWPEAHSGSDIQQYAGADASTAQFVQQMLPLCNHHAFVQLFICQHSKYEYGALSAKLAHLMQRSCCSRHNAYLVSPRYGQSRTLCCTPRLVE